MKNGSVSLIYGNWLMVICACFYLAWWIITFRPPEPKGTPVGRICLVMAFLTGLGGLFWCIKELNTQTDSAVNRGIPGMVIVLAAAVVSLIFYLLYYNLPYTQEYVDGCIPLGLVAVVMAGINLAVWTGMR